MKHGGKDNGGIVNVGTLTSWFKKHKNWKNIGTNPDNGVAGCVITYKEQNFMSCSNPGHTCFYVGKGIVDCHNNNHCGARASAVNTHGICAVWCNKNVLTDPPPPRVTNTTEGIVV